MRGHTLPRLVSVALLPAVAPWWLGCATEIHLRRTPGAQGTSGGGRLVVRVFETRSDLRRDVATRQAVVTELYRVDGRQETLLREERDARWAVPDLPAARYVLRVARVVRDGGAVRDLASPQEETIEIRAHETTVADVVLSDPAKAWVTVAIVVGAGIVVARTYHPMGGSFGWR